MQQQTKDDLKEAWVRSLPVFKSVALVVAKYVSFVLWVCTFIYLICTAFWFGCLQLALTVVGVTVYAKYEGIQDEREYEARERERTKRRGY